MSFKFVQALSGDNFPLQRSVATTASTHIPADGAIAIANGKTILAVDTVKPRFISAGAVAASATPKETTVQDVLSHYVWETTFSADATAIQLGDKVTIHADGLQVTATTTGGVATVERMFGTSVGSTVWVRFE